MEDIRPFPTLSSFDKAIVTSFRALLGIILLIIGIRFIFVLPELQALVAGTGLHLNAQLFSYIISIVHICGGVLITIGLLTRIAIIVQIPILIAAVWANYATHSPSANWQLLLSITVLILLVYYLMIGPGEISMDNYRRMHQL